MPYRTSTISLHQEPSMSILPTIRPVIRLVKLLTFIPLVVLVFGVWLGFSFLTWMGTMVLGYLFYRNPTALMRRTGRWVRDYENPDNYFAPFAFEKDEGKYYGLGSPLHWSFMLKLWPWFWDLCEEKPPTPSTEKNCA